MKLFILILSLGILVGCDQPPEKYVNNKYHEVCIDEVTYLHRVGGHREAITVKLNPDSTVETCDE